MTNKGSLDCQSNLPHRSPRARNENICHNAHLAATRSRFWNVVGPSLAFAGVQISWAVQIGHGTSELRKLGISDRLVGLAWLAGPITGVVVQPIVGVLSDGCKSRFGRRRPFMLLGAFGIFFSLLLFSNAENIAHIVHGKSLNSGNEQSNALFIAITGFWLLDAMTNTLQGPARSLLGDVIRPEEQLLGNACFSVANGLGKCIGYFLGSITTKIELIYGTAAAISLFLSLITIVTIHEQASDELQETAFVSPESERSGYSSSPKCPSDASEANVTATKFCVSAPMTRAFTVQCFTYFAWMILYVYGSDWVGKEVFNGDADAAPKSAGRKSFELGVMTANRGLLIMSLLSIPIGVLLPFLIRKVNVKVIWSLSLLLFSTMLVLCKVFISRYFVIIMFGLLSLPLAVSYTIPWTIAGLSVEKGAAGSRGTQLALFNLSQSLPGILAALVSGLVVRASGGDLGYVMSLGGCSALFACIAVIFTIIPDELARTRGVEFEQSISIRGNTV